MPKSTNSTHNDDSDNDFSSDDEANENSNLSEINPLILSGQASLLRTASQLTTASAAAFANQNSSSSTSSSLVNANGNGNNGALINNSNQNSNASSSASGSGGGSGQHNKKFRHQHFSKNIYIGTKNAERWDNLRNLFQFKNDVEFVSFLLSTAENEARSKNG